MTIASCPKCSDEVALPAGASPKATVRCPLCQDEFLLSDILDGMPPLLIVVDDPEVAASTGAEVPAFAPAATGDEGRLDFAGAGPVSAAPSFGIDSSVSPTTSAKPTTRRRRAASRPKRKRSPAMEVVKIALGGIAGLAIAQLILWWNPWKPTDPFGIAPKLGGAAPWIVPAKFHDEKEKKPKDHETTDKKAPTKQIATPNKKGELPTLSFDDPNKTGPVGEAKRARKAGRKTKPPQSGGITAAGDVDATADVFEPKPATVPSDPMDPADIEPNIADLGDGLVGDLPIDLDPGKMLDPPTSPEPEDPGAESLEPDDATESAPVRFSNAPKVTDAELNEALEDAQTIARAWNLAEGNSVDLLRQTYRALAELGEAITFAGQGSELDEVEVAGVLKSLTDDGKKLAILGKVGDAWLNSKRDNAGVLVLGVVKSIEQKGDLYETKLATPSGSLLSMYNDTDPADAYKVDADILVLGAIIDDPASNLTGYEGDAASVVWRRLSVVVPKR